MIPEVQRRPETTQSFHWRKWRRRLEVWSYAFARELIGLVLRFAHVKNRGFQYLCNLKQRMVGHTKALKSRKNGFAWVWSDHLSSLKTANAGQTSTNAPSILSSCTKRPQINRSGLQVTLHTPVAIRSLASTDSASLHVSSSSRKGEMRVYVSEMARVVRAAKPWSS